MANKQPSRRGWKPGPWDNEPDLDEWVDEATGLTCIAARNYSGAWRGYVAINDPGHPLYGYGDYDEFPDDIRDAAHGDITWAGFHGEFSNRFLIGFDCAHAGDDYPLNTFTSASTYCDLPYVKQCLTRLAAAVAAVAATPGEDAGA